MNIFPPAAKEMVTELVGDGHKKVHSRRECKRGSGEKGKGSTKKKDNKKKQKQMKRKGKRDRRRKRETFTHGWFMNLDPKSKRIVSVQRQDEPENNKIVAKALKRVIHLYPKCTAYIMDRNCKFKKDANKEPAFDNIEHYIIDKWHDQKHYKKCECSPVIHP